MPSLAALIEEVEHASPSPEPLALLETASASVRNLDDLTDSMLSHFVDKCRRSGHSWAEIGAALGVTKQAVQKRFTTEMINPEGWERFTERARRLVTEHAPAAAESLGHNWVGTEHLLLGFYAEPEALAPRVLEAFGLDREKVVAGDRRPHRTRRVVRREGPVHAARVGGARRRARAKPSMLGHNYVGTEHQLLALLTVSAASAPRSSLTRTSPTTAHGRRWSSS